MLFSSYEFILFMILLLCVYYFTPVSKRWFILLLGSYVFYAFGGIIQLAFIITTTVAAYFTAIIVSNNAAAQKEFNKLHSEDMTKEERKTYGNKQKKIRYCYTFICVLFCLVLLALSKNLSLLFSGILKSVPGEKLSFLSLAMPMGISFYMLQVIGYLVDVYRGSVKAERNILKFALFVSFFPQLIQGPISRFSNLSESLYGEHKFDIKNIANGLERVVWGFFKKLVIADRIFSGVSTLIGDNTKYAGAYAFIAMIMYTIQLYADFTGGIDITIGIAEMFGVKLTENFIRPYFSKSLKEYWRRWHISMSSWFKDYVFYPLSISKPIQNLTKFSRKHFGNSFGKRVPVYLSTIIVWFLTGIWHGTTMNFIVWGLANCFVLMISEELEPLYSKFQAKTHADTKWIYRLFMMGRTFLLICFLNLFDCYSNVLDTIKSIRSMFTVYNWNVIFDGSLLKIGLSVTDYIVILFGTTVMLIVSLIGRGGSVREKYNSLGYYQRFAIGFGMILVILLAGAYGIGYDSAQFIYNRF